MTSVADWKSRGQVLPLCGHNIFVIDESPAMGIENASDDGQPTILFIHGFPTSSWDWAPIWPVFSPDYRMIALDLLGLGFSDKPYPHTYSIHEQADIIEALIRALGLKEFHVFAHDYGDTVAQEIMARQNEADTEYHLKSVCFLNGGLFPETHKAILIQKLLLSPIGPWVNKLTTKRLFDKSFSSVFGAQTKPSQQELQDFWDIINDNKGRHAFHSLITYMNDRREHRVRWIEAIKQSQCPVGVINGSVDPVSGAHMVARYKELIGQPDYLKELPAIGHYPHVEAPREVTQAYKEFIGS